MERFSSAQTTRRKRNFSVFADTKEGREKIKRKKKEQPERMKYQKQEFLIKNGFFFFN